MKTKFISAMAASLALLSFSSCESSSKLANDLQGSWSGATEKLIDNEVAPSSYMPVLTFVKTDATKGDVTITAAISMSDANGNTTLSASGQSTISGTWTATDDDEIYLNLDPSTLNVNVDPDGVVMSSTGVYNTPEVTTDSLKASMIPAIKTRMTSAIQHHMLNITKIDDIKIKNGIMTCEINDKDLSFHAIE